MRCHSVCSFVSPLALSRHFSVVAMRMLQTASPLGRKRVSGSAPRLPIRMTLLTEAMEVLPVEERRRAGRRWLLRNALHGGRAGHERADDQPHPREGKTEREDAR